MIYVIHPDGTTTEYDEGKPSLERMQQLVGGYVRKLPHFTRFKETVCAAYVDEDGNVKHASGHHGFGVNNTAMGLWQANSPHSSRLVGNMVILTGESKKGW